MTFFEHILDILRTVVGLGIFAIIFWLLFGTKTDETYASPEDLDPDYFQKIADEQELKDLRKEVKDLKKKEENQCQKKAGSHPEGRDP